MASAQLRTNIQHPRFTICPTTASFTSNSGGSHVHAAGNNSGTQTEATPSLKLEPQSCGFRLGRVIITEDMKMGVGREGVECISMNSSSSGPMGVSPVRRACLPSTEPSLKVSRPVHKQILMTKRRFSDLGEDPYTLHPVKAARIAPILVHQRVIIAKKPKSDSELGEPSTTEAPCPEKSAEIDMSKLPIHLQLRLEHTLRFGIHWENGHPSPTIQPGNTNGPPLFVSVVKHHPPPSPKAAANRKAASDERPLITKLVFCKIPKSSRRKFKIEPNQILRRCLWMKQIRENVKDPVVAEFRVFREEKEKVEAALEERYWGRKPTSTEPSTASGRKRSVESSAVIAIEVSSSQRREEDVRKAVKEKKTEVAEMTKQLDTARAEIDRLNAEMDMIVKILDARDAGRLKF